MTIMKHLQQIKTQADKRKACEDQLLPFSKALFEANWARAAQIILGNLSWLYDHSIIVDCKRIYALAKGKAIQCYQDGSLQSETNLQKNMKYVGQYLRFHSNGVPSQYKQYNKHGNLSGKITEFYHDGSLSFEGNYRNGKVTGMVRRWHYGGRLARETFYKNGKRHGICKAWWDNEKHYLDFIAIYKDGHVMSEEMYSPNTGRKIRIEQYKLSSNGDRHRVVCMEFDEYTGELIYHAINNSINNKDTVIYRRPDNE